MLVKAKAQVIILDLFMCIDTGARGQVFSNVIGAVTLTMPIFNFNTKTKPRINDFSHQCQRICSLCRASLSRCVFARDSFFG